MFYASANFVQIIIKDAKISKFIFYYAIYLMYLYH